MKVILLPLGSHGDVHPFAGLSLCLQRRGHDVTMVTSGLFADLAERCGIPFRGIGSDDDIQQLLNDPNIWNPRKAAMVIANKVIKPSLQLQFNAIRELATPGETVLVGSALGFGARIAHEALNLPLVTLHLQPTMFWSVYESPWLARGTLLGKGVPRWLKQLQFRIGLWMAFDRSVLKTCNAFRAEHGLGPVKTTWDLMHSPQRICGMFPDWLAAPQPDWPSQTVLTGFPRWDERGVTPLDPQIDQFLSAGDPPIAFTPGSGHTHATSFWKAAVDACGRLGRRGMLLTRHAEQIPKNLPEGVQHFAYAPFSEILPRCAALVYHGGIGTLSQALAAGVPHVIMPMAHDQPDNAMRIRRLGVGDFLWPAKFRGPRLAAMLQRLIDSESVHEACRHYARLAAADDAIEATCNVIEECGRSSWVTKTN